MAADFHTLVTFALSGEVGTSGNTLAIVPAPESSSHTGSGAVAVRQEHADAPPTWAMSIQDGMAKMMEVMQHNVMPAVAAGNDYLEHKVGAPCQRDGQ